MHPEVNSDPAPGYTEVSSVVQLNPVTFNLAMLAMGVPETDAARGRAIGVDAKSIRSALGGKPVGNRLIGNAIVTFRKHEARLARLGLKVDMDTFFTVSEPAAVS